MENDNRQKIIEAEKNNDDYITRKPNTTPKSHKNIAERKPKHITERKRKYITERKRNINNDIFNINKTTVGQQLTLHNLLIGVYETIDINETNPVVSNETNLEQLLNNTDLEQIKKDAQNIIKHSKYITTRNNNKQLKETHQNLNKTISKINGVHFQDNGTSYNFVVGSNK